ncbi:Gfo/Idh/MocA family oxidoreductase [Mesorhizobium sp. M0816]|uniref:Gfo/Idh/MocA family protein n=1 Tax=Mesorhizobium sp. M0816 TaxID=2957006 RepID=UPI0033397AB4
MKRLTAAVIGLGLGRLHAKNYMQNPAVERVVVCDPDPAQLDRLRHELPELAAFHADIATMLKEERPDVVSIVTPDHMHRGHVEEVMASGHHVLLTKPIANSRVDAEAIVATGQASGKQLMVAHEARFRARFQMLRQLVAEGYFGDIISVRLDSIWDKRDHFAHSPWYASREADRSVLTGTGIHEVDLVRFIVGQQASRVYASGNDLGDLDFPRQKTVVATIDFSDGCIAQVGATYVARWPKAGEVPDQIRIIGTKGMVIGDRYSHDGEDEWRYLPTPGNTIEDGTKGCVDAFVDAIANDRPVAVSGEDALASMTLCFAADESAASGQPVLISDTEPMRRRA